MQLLAYAAVRQLVMAGDLAAALASIEKDFGSGAIMKMGDKSQMAIEAIPTGAVTLDRALGVGGLPKGRIVEIFGPESSGKSTLAMHVVAQAQQTGGVCAYVDAEHAMDPVYAEAIGVDINELLISQPGTAEEALEITDRLVHSGMLSVVVVDSVAALTPRAEIEGDMGDSHMGLQARLMGQALRKMTGAANNTNTMVIFINQLREKVGVMFGNPEVTTGGRALKFYASVRLDIRRIESLKQGLDVIGSRVKVRVVKNKVAAPFRAAELDLLYNDGISFEGSVLDAGLEAGVIEKSGAWFSYGETRLGQGRENVRDLLRTNRELTAEIAAKVRQAVLGEPVAATPEGEPEEASVLLQ